MKLLIPFHLCGKHPIVFGIFLDQLVVCALLDQFSVFHYKDPIGKFHRCQTMRDKNTNLVSVLCDHIFYNFRFGNGINTGVGFVKDNDRTFASEKTSCNRNPLPFPSRKVYLSETGTENGILSDLLHHIRTTHCSRFPLHRK